MFAREDKYVTSDSQVRISALSVPYLKIVDCGLWLVGLPLASIDHFPHVATWRHKSARWRNPREATLDTLDKVAPGPDTIITFGRCTKRSGRSEATSYTHVVERYKPM